MNLGIMPLLEPVIQSIRNENAYYVGEINMRNFFDLFSSFLARLFIILTVTNARKALLPR